MSAKSSAVSLLRVLKSLEKNHGFSVKVVLKPLYEPDCPIQDIQVVEKMDSPGFWDKLSFSGYKPLREGNVAKVYIEVSYSTMYGCWWLSKLEIINKPLVYDYRNEQLYHAWMEPGFKILSSSEFLEHIAKSASQDRERDSWIISKGQDLVAFFEAYDEAAKFFGCVPIFLG